MVLDQTLADRSQGRSAYEAVGDNETGLSEQSASVVPSEVALDGIQQYDTRGNPINPQSKACQEAQIRAKNEVLEAVGVCERKNKKRSSSGYLHLSPEEWAVFRDIENEWGSDLFLFADITHLACSWWIETLLSRIQTGFVDGSVSFSTVLASEWHNAFSHGIPHAFDYLSSGALMGALHRMILSYSDDSVNIFFADFRSTLRRLKISGSAKRFLIHHTKHLKNFTQTLILLCLSPLPIYSALAQLHLFSSPYGLPPVSSFLPWHPSSPLVWAWGSGPETAPFSTRLFHLSTSPVSLVLAMNALYDWVDNTGAVLEHWEQPSILGPPTNNPGTEAPSFLQPLIWARDKTLDLLGWSPRTWNRLQEDHYQQAFEQVLDKEWDEEEDIAEARERAGLTRDGEGLRPVTYRQSGLAYVPAELLSRRLHSFVWRVMLLPLEGWVFRSVAQSWLQSGLPAVLAPSISAPSTSSILDFRDWGAGGISGYVSKVGLCTGLHAVVDSMVWGLVYKIVKYSGMGRFHWGKT